MVKLLSFFIFIDATVGFYFASPDFAPSYQVLQYLSAFPMLYGLRSFMFNYLYKPRLVVQFIMENYYS
jgi:hypothetical protein